jgi:hypothetical protein
MGIAANVTDAAQPRPDFRVGIANNWGLLIEGYPANPDPESQTMSSPFATLTPEQRDYLLHALDVTREHDQQHMDWLLSDAAENEPDRVDQSAATERALALADQLAVLLPTPDSSCRSTSLSRRSGDVPRRGPALFALPSLCFTLVGTAVQVPNARHEMILLPPRNSETADRVQPS